MVGQQITIKTINNASKINLNGRYKQLSKELFRKYMIYILIIITFTTIVFLELKQKKIGSLQEFISSLNSKGITKANSAIDKINSRELATESRSLAQIDHKINSVLQKKQITNDKHQKNHQLSQNKKSKNQYSFQKIVWVYYQDFGKDNNPYLSRFHINRWFTEHNNDYKLMVLHSQNLKEFLSSQQISFIDQKINKMKVNQKQSNKKTNNIKQQYIRLCILQKYGGIFLDSEFLLAQNLSWFDAYFLQQTGNNNQQNNHNKNKIVNKWGQQPQIFLFYQNKFHQQSTAQELQQQKITKNSFNNSIYTFINSYHEQNITQIWNLDYEDYFIASKRNSKLIQQWRAQFQKVILQNLQQTKNHKSKNDKKPNIQTKVNQRCQDYYRSTKNQINYLSKTLKCIIHRKQYQLNQDAFKLQQYLDYWSSARYYQIWSVQNSYTNLKYYLIQKDKNLQLKPDTQNELSLHIRINPFIRLQISSQIIQKHISQPQLLTKLKDLLLNSNTKKQTNEAEIKIFDQIQKIYRINEQQKIKLQSVLKRLNDQIEKQNNEKIKQQEQYQNKISNKKLKLTKKVWLFLQKNIEEYRYLHQQNIKTILKYANQSNYQVVYIKPSDSSTYYLYLSKQNLEKIKHISKLLDQRNLQTKYLTQSNSSQKEQKIDLKSYVLTKLLKFMILYQNGGVVIDKQFVVLENLSWIENVLVDNIHINYGNKQHIKNPQVFAFYDPIYSSFKSKQNINRQYQTEKYMTTYPSLQTYFIASIKKSQLLLQLINNCIDLLKKQYKSTVYTMLSYKDKLIGKSFQSKSIYQSMDRLALHYILQKKQQQLQQTPFQRLVQKDANLPGEQLKYTDRIQVKQTQQKPYSGFAIDHYGFITINAYIGPLKFQKYFRFQYDNRTYHHLKDLSIKQFQGQIGQLHYLVKLPYQNYIQSHLLKYQQSINRRSFLYQYYLSYESNDFLQLKKYGIHEQLVQINPVAQEWKNLSKIIWIVWDTGINKSSAFTQACYNNLKRSAIKSGFVINVVNQNNLHTFLSKQLYEKVQYSMKYADYRIGRQAISDIWRISLLYEHGGVYFDASTYQMTTSFEWLKYITRLPSNLIWNKYQKTPQVIIFFNPFYGSPFNWQYNEKYNTKKVWHIAYENNFIAAQKGTKLLSDMVDALIKYMVYPYDDVERIMDQANLQKFYMVSRDDRYLAGLSSIKYVLGMKQNQMRQKNFTGKYENSADFYKLWGMNGFLIGQQKIRGSQNNYEVMDDRFLIQELQVDNPYRYRYRKSYSQSIIGPVKYQVKFFSPDLKFMNILINQQYKRDQQNFNLTRIIHPESIMYSRLNLGEMGGIIKYYSQLSRQKLQFKGYNKVWY